MSEETEATGRSDDAEDASEELNAIAADLENKAKRLRAMAQKSPTYHG